MGAVQSHIIIIKSPGSFLITALVIGNADSHTAAMLLPATEEEERRRRRRGEERRGRGRNEGVRERKEREKGWWEV